MLKHLVSRAAVLFWLLPVVLSSALPARAETSKPSPHRRLLAAGSERVLWLVASEWDSNEEEFTRRYFYQDAGSDRVNPVTVTPYPHRIGAIAVGGDTLHVIRVDGSHVCLSKTRRWTAHRLPGDVAPLTLAGESQLNGGRVWAVVSAETAAQVELAWQEKEARRARDNFGDEQPSAPKSPDSPSSVQAPPSSKSFHLVVYDGAAWQPGSPVIGDYSGETHVWLAENNGRLHLFWAPDNELEQVRYAMLENGTWLMGAPISLSGPIDKAAVAVINKQLVFAALLKDAGHSGLRCEQWSRAAASSIQDPWDKAGPLNDEKGDELLLPAGSAIGLFNDRLAIFRFGPGEPELATWIVGATAKQEKSFEPVPALTGREGPGTSHGVRDLISTLVVVAVVLLLFWRRQESGMNPLELPNGLQIAGPGRRAVGFLIDAAPAAAIVVWLYFDPIASFYHELQAAAQARQPMRDAPTEVLWAWFWFRVIYVSYSTVFELLWTTTPGKRLLGCRVFAESLERPSFVQIGIRNISRMVELEPFLQIWPFMLIVFFTRNRQRLGDLLARTIVIELQPHAEEEENDEIRI